MIAPSRTLARPDRRRPRPLLIGVLATVALLGVLAWMRYDPVVRGAAGWCPDGSTLMPERTAEGAEESEGVVCTVVNTETGTVAFATSVRNDGPLPLRVRAVRLVGEVQGVLRVEEVRMAIRNDVVDAGTRELVPFRPFRLGAGQQRIIEVRGTLVPCGEVPRARAATFRSMPLRTTLFRLPHDSGAPLDPPVRLIAEPC